MNPYTTNASGESIGCDLGDKTHKIVVLRSNGSLERHKVKATRLAMRACFSRPACRVFIGAGRQERAQEGEGGRSAKALRAGAQAVLCRATQRRGLPP